VKTAIVIPARYGSTRLPGKPLALIGGKSMLSRVVDVANKAAKGLSDVSILVATDDPRIAEHAQSFGANAVMTPEDCKTGSDRALAALDVAKLKPDIVINLQGDAPFTPVSAVRGIIDALGKNKQAEVATPVYHLSWEALDKLRSNKRMTPFSGTTAVVTADGRAMWFSKTIIPGIRKEKALREKSETSPILQHIGLYGFRLEALKKFCSLPMGQYELLEGLEQLRMLEAGMHVQTVTVTLPRGLTLSGIDSPEDLKRAQELASVLDHAS
jgi:3-deoxy-manno-octulosonate cytidylyltransferase (CMP-KDO synthetase)